MLRTDTALTPILLKDYAPYPFTVESVDLAFALDPAETEVTSRMTLRRTGEGPLRLDGEAIRLVSVRLNGVDLKRSEYRLDQGALTLDAPDERDGTFEVEIVTTCRPSENTTLMGLYTSGGRFCTQCEAEGFRRITYYPDRPDVMSVFTTRIEADKAGYPFLLSNGNLTDSGDLPEGRHYAVWNDPHRKPAYLFALVAGAFDVLHDGFTTLGGREVSLEIYIDPGQRERATYAMDALKRAMRWDEDAYGREYDLDRFMVVAVRDFNFGAMENKGLNIFNSSLLVADPKTTTDPTYERIESVVAHEYFHNWTGNRITCRDWFQLCLKEGFTVFRDQQFSADQRDPTVQRIKDVKMLRARQFPEDGGPLAHAVRPESFVKIDNFYTATIYEKGAEIIRMIAAWLGPERFRAGADRYFEALDGTAATVEDFLATFGEGAGADLSPFMDWYRQAGTPVVTVATRRSGDTLQVHLEQRTAPTPGQTEKRPLPIPVRYQAVGDTGPVGDAGLCLLKEREGGFDIALPESTDEVTLSAFGGFSAPVTVRSEQGVEDRLRLVAYDPDGFNRWEAGQQIAQGLILDIARALVDGRVPPQDRALRGYGAALARTLDAPEFSDAFKALVLSPPAELDVYLSAGVGDPLAVRAAVEWLSRAVADHLADRLLAAVRARTPNDAAADDFDPGADAAGRRALRNRALMLLAIAHHPQAAPLAIAQLSEATNMTDEMSALQALARLGGRRVDDYLEDFRARYADEPLVIDRWFALEAGRNAPGGLAHVRALLAREDFTPANPNRVRAALGAFAHANPAFHRADGAGYRFLGACIAEVAALNPQVAARLLGLFVFWPKVDAERQTHILAVLEALLQNSNPDNVREIAQRLLEAETRS